MECQQQQQVVKSRLPENAHTTTAILGDKLAHSHWEKKEFSRILVRIESLLNLIFTANIRGFYSHIGPITFVLWLGRPATDCYCWNTPTDKQQVSLLPTGEQGRRKQR